MADDIATKTMQAAALNKELGNTPDAIAEIARENKTYQRIALAASKKRKQVLDEEFKSYKRVKSEISSMADLTESSIERFSKAQTKALRSSNATSMMQLQAIKAQGLNISATAKNLEYLNAKLLDTANSYKDVTKSYISSVQKYNETLQSLDRELKSGKINQDQYTESLSKAQVEIDDVREMMVNLENDAEGVTKAVLEQRKAFVRHVGALRDEKKAAISVDIEYRKLKGGVEGLAASFEEVGRAKMSEMLSKVEGPAGMTLGVKFLGDAWTNVAEVYRSTNKLAITMGDTNRRSFSNFAKSIMDAQRMAGNMQQNVGRLGYTMEEMNDVVQKIRVGIRFDREGRLGVTAINNLTNETALFARMCNIDLSEAVNMASTRIHQYGMSSEEAISDMTQMRATLLAMSSGIKGTNVPLDDMVKLIDEASQSSQSYIVDARLMTQAMRGAANQAVAMGASKKQAMEITKGMGEVLSKAPEFISLPVGMDLLSQLTGGDSENFLSKFDEATRKQLRDIKKMADEGTVNPYYLAKSLNDVIGSSNAGIEAQLDRFSLYLKGDKLDAAITVLMKGYGIKNVNTAMNIAKMLKTVQEERQMFKDDMFDVGLLLSGQASSLEDIASSTVKSKTQKIKELENLGLSAKKAEEYLTKYNEKTDEYLAAEKELAAARAVKKDTGGGEARVLAAEKAMAVQRTRMTLQTAELAMQPGNAMLRELRKLEGGKTVAIDAKLSKGQLESIGVKGWKDLGNKLGVGLDENKEELQNMYRDGVTASQMDAMHAKDMAVSKAAKEAVEAPENNIKGIFDRLGYMGPIATTIAGLALIIGGPMGLKNLKTAFSWGFGTTLPTAFKAIKGLPGQTSNFVKDFFAKRSLSKAAKVARETSYGKGSTYVEEGAIQIGKKASEAASTAADAAKKSAEIASKSKEAYGKGSTYVEDALTLGGKASKSGKLEETVLKEASKALKAEKTAGFLAKFKNLIPNMLKLNKGKLTKGALIASLAATVGAMFWTKDAKAAEAPEGGKPVGPEGTTEGEKPQEEKSSTAPPLAGAAAVGTGAGVYTLAKMAKAAKLAKAAKAAKIVKTGVVAAKGLKLATKSLKMIPFVGNIVSGAFAINSALELYKKWQKDPKSITPSDKAQMVAELAGMIPYIGNVVAAGDLAMSMSGGYDALDAKYKGGAAIGSLASARIPEAGGFLYEQAKKAAPTNFDDKQIAGTRISAPSEPTVGGGRSEGRGAQVAAKGRAQASPMSIKSNGDFEVKLTIENFVSALTGHKKQVASLS